MAPKPRSDAALAELAAYFRLLAEPARLRILDVLSGGELSVLAIVTATGLKQAHVSRQLGRMAGEGLLGRRKEGTRVYYRLRDSRLAELMLTAERSLKEHLRGRLGGLDS